MADNTAPPCFRLLGHLEIDGQGDVDLRGLKQRMLLAYLLLHSGQVIATERLVEAVWGERPPPTATAVVHTYVRKLRAALAETPAELVTRAPGYVLYLPEHELDVRVFERLARAASSALKRSEFASANELLTEALALWHGDALADLPEEGFVGPERARLEQLRLEATLDKVDAELATGGAGELVAELQSIIREHPYQERARRQLMLALYRNERQADALELYRDTRRLFADELGIEPSESLRELEQAMLRQDRSLQAPQPGKALTQPSSPPVRRRPRLRRSLIPAVLLAAVAGVALWVVLERPTTSASSSPRTRKADIIASFDLPQPSCCGFGFDSAWGVGHHDDALRKIDPRTNRIVGSWPAAGYQSGVPVAAAGSIWIPSARDNLVRFDPARGKVTARIPVQGSQVGFGYLSLWETTRTHQLDRVDLRTNTVTSSIRLAAGGNNWDDPMAIGEGAVWVAVADNANLIRVDPLTNRIVASITGFGDTDSGMPLAVDQNAVWALRFVGGQLTLFRVDPATNHIAARIAVGAPNGAGLAGTVTTGDGYVWTGNWDDSISKIDPRTNRVVGVYRLPSAPQNVAFADGSLWVDSYDASKVWRIDPNR